ncbi:quaternary ammonium compound-resistance protein SugE [Bacillus sp. JCM 19046]|uniref:Paired small multidrug resistance pump n=1 Tax=Shouchella xiaoxiensis TaxID=766895 RepID=A0ABS2SVF9_9BACI|nr:multidrug efflux SMR transporter [Shouchella xiaoxiensis]MBM7839524.1 paired small multidrug resistance pump [Shouchella xiaoxiensis]GAF15433.1 quaternary ammonium compound-resistance protein SugE [Bacillus sp. JCM 19045]GAF19537.1 quaternary ammonium compound-resistance protein SugE [Bacillus sp. JCM 19046]
MSWVLLILAGIFEVVGVSGIQMITKGEKKKGFLVLIIGFIISFSFLAIAMEAIPLGVAYAVWTGIGTVGSAVVGMVYYNESKDRMRIFFIGLVVVAVIGLRIVS